MSQLPELLKYVVEDHGTLTQQQGCSVLREMLEGDATDIQIASLVTAIATRGPTVDELSGFVQATAKPGNVRCPRCGRLTTEKSDHRHRRFLRASEVRPNHGTAEDSDEVAPLH